MTLNTHKMIFEVDDLVQTDFVGDMLNKSGKYTQKEAEQMSDLIGQIYTISHCLHCKACNGKYKIKT